VLLGKATSQRVQLHGFEVVFGMSAMAPRLQKGWKKKLLREIILTTSSQNHAVEIMLAIIAQKHTHPFDSL